jgi:hypothetical protein
MSHNGLHERVLIEVARTKGSNYGKRGVSYSTLRQNVRSFQGMSYADVCEFGLDFDCTNRISNGQAAQLFRTRGMSLDRLNPLESFLRSKVGLEWGHVDAEIRNKIKGRGDSVRHVLEHAYEFVDLHPVWIDGVPHRNPGNHYSSDPLVKGEFYVDGEGILCIIPPCCHINRWRRVPKPVFESAILNGKNFVLIDRKHWALPWSDVEEFGWYLFDTTVTYKRRLVLNPDGTPRWHACGLPVLELDIVPDKPERQRKASLKELAALEELRGAPKNRKKYRQMSRISKARLRGV